jgi:hypothetical protein
MGYVDASGKEPGDNGVYPSLPLFLFLEHMCNPKHMNAIAKTM